MTWWQWLLTGLGGVGAVFAFIAANGRALARRHGRS